MVIVTKKKQDEMCIMTKKESYGKRVANKLTIRYYRYRQWEIFIVSIK